MISYAITIKDELKEIKSLLSVLFKLKTKEDEIVIVQDQTNFNEDVFEYLHELTNHNKISHYMYKFNNNFSDMKNFLNRKCTKKWIFNIDADEIPHEVLLKNLYEILEANDNIDALWVPRVNIVNGLTYEHIKRWGWIVNDKGWVNWPHDAQCRLYKNIETISWTKPVHEQLSGYKTVSKLPDAEEYSILHIKDIKKQERQNEFYSKNY